MEFDYSKIKLNQNDIDTLHDVIFNALDKENLTNEEVIDYWNALPGEIKINAVRWD